MGNIVIILVTNIQSVTLLWWPRKPLCNCS